MFPCRVQTLGGFLNLRSAGWLFRSVSAVAPALIAPCVVAASPNERSARVRLVAVGDICLAGGVERASHKAEPTYPFTAMLRTLQSADIAFGNLECVLSARGRPVPKRYNFRARPAWAKKLYAAGFDVLSVANNHTLDYGRAALADTVRHLREAGIVAVGAGETLSEALRVRILQRRGLRIGFLAYLGMFPPLLPIIADQPCVAMGHPHQVRRDVADARKQVDVLIVSVHAGVERQSTPSARQREIGRAAVDAGADLVLGHHPHIVQPVESYRGKPICYSLGNFVFDPSPAVLRNPAGPWSAMAVADLGPDGSVRVQLVPLRLQNRRPQLHGDSISRTVLCRP